MQLGAIQLSAFAIGCWRRVVSKLQNWSVLKSAKKSKIDRFTSQDVDIPSPDLHWPKYIFFHHAMIKIFIVIDVRWIHFVPWFYFAINFWCVTHKADEFYNMFSSSGYQSTRSVQVIVCSTFQQPCPLLTFVWWWPLYWIGNISPKSEIGWTTC